MFNLKTILTAISARLLTSSFNSLRVSIVVPRPPDISLLYINLFSLESFLSKGGNEIPLTVRAKIIQSELSWASVSMCYVILPKLTIILRCARKEYHKEKK